LRELNICMTIRVEQNGPRYKGDISRKKDSGEGSSFFEHQTQQNSKQGTKKFPRFTKDFRCHQNLTQRSRDEKDCLNEKKSRRGVWGGGKGARRSLNSGESSAIPDGVCLFSVRESLSRGPRRPDKKPLKRLYRGSKGKSSGGFGFIKRKVS